MNTELGLCKARMNVNSVIGTGKKGETILGSMMCIWLSEPTGSNTHPPSTERSWRVGGVRWFC